MERERERAAKTESRGEGIGNVSKTSTGGLHFKNVVFVLLARSKKKEGGQKGERGREENKRGERFNFENTRTDAYLWLCVINALYDKANNSHSASQTSL